MMLRQAKYRRRQKQLKSATKAIKAQKQMDALEVAELPQIVTSSTRITNCWYFPAFNNGTGEESGA